MLDEHGDAVVVYDLRGSLVFATADRLFEELLPGPEARSTDGGIAQARRVSWDLTGVNVLREIAAPRPGFTGGRSCLRMCTNAPRPSLAR